MLRPELVEALATLSDDIAEAMSNPDRESLIRLWHDCCVIQRDLKDMIAAVEQTAVRLMPWEEHVHPRSGKVTRRPGNVTIDGLGTLTVQRGSTRTTWDHDRTARLVVDQAMRHGMIDHPRDVAVVLQKVGHIDYWRVGQLKELDIDPDDEAEDLPGGPLREVEPGPSRLRFL